ncbi:MAG: hypothetical protein WA001_01085 [Patescibacteria group bacterium]
MGIKQLQTFLQSHLPAHEARIMEFLKELGAIDREVSHQKETLAGDLNAQVATALFWEKSKHISVYTEYDSRGALLTLTHSLGRELHERFGRMTRKRLNPQNSAVLNASVRMCMEQTIFASHFQFRHSHRIQHNTDASIEEALFICFANILGSNSLDIGLFRPLLHLASRSVYILGYDQQHNPVVMIPSDFKE